MEEEETEFCSNCKRDIPAVNYVMHAVHCKRNIVLCKECQEPVAISQQEEHFEENHAKVKCECGQEMERMQLEDHKDSDCPCRKVTCSYCELELPFSEMNNHQDYCGSRTEMCEKCNTFVKLKDMDVHTSSDCELPVPPKPQLPNPDDVDKQLDYELSVDTLNAMGVFGSDNLGYRDLQALIAGMQDEWIRPQLTPRQSEIWTNTRVDEPTNKPLPRNNVVARGWQPFQNTNTLENVNEKNFVQKIKPIPFYGRNVYSDSEEPSSPQYEGDDDHLLAAYLANTFGETADGPSELSSRTAGVSDSPSGMFAEGFNSLEETCLPCEFCGVMCPASELILHQSGCQASSTAMQYPELRSPPRSLPPLNNEPETRRFKDNNRTDLFAGPAEYSQEAECTDEEPFLPCEFCNVLLPASSIIEHQVNCESCPESRPQSTRTFGSQSVINPIPLLNNAPQTGNVSRTQPKPSFETDEEAVPESLDEELARGNSQTNSKNGKQVKSSNIPFSMASSGIDSNISDNRFISQSAARDNKRNYFRGNQTFSSRNHLQRKKILSNEERPFTLPQESYDTSSRVSHKNLSRGSGTTNNHAVRRDRRRIDQKRLPSHNDEAKPISSNGFCGPEGSVLRNSVTRSPVFQNRTSTIDEANPISSNGFRGPERSFLWNRPDDNINPSVTRSPNRTSTNNASSRPLGLPKPRNATGNRHVVEMSTQRNQKPITSSVLHRQNGERNPRDTRRTQGSAPGTGTKRSISRKKIV